MNTFTYRTQLEKIKNYYIIRLPQDISDQMSSRGMVMVDAIIEGETIKLPLEPNGSKGHFVLIETKIVTHLKLDASACFVIQITVTKDWIPPSLPNDFRLALDSNGLANHWKSITSKAKWEWVRWIRSTKNQDTRTKRVETAVSMLSEGKKRPCCFNQTLCTITDLCEKGILLNKKTPD